MVIPNGRRMHLRSSISQCDDIDYENQYYHDPDDIKENKTLAREVKGCSNILFYSSIFICIDVSRQIAGYGMKYYNQDQFPVEPTEIVAFSEVLKVIVFLVRILHEEGSCLFLNRLSWRYLIPALLYAVNSNIYFVAMHYTTPPFWNILLQLRVIFTALMYRVVFSKTIKPVQWLALLLLTSSIFISKFSSSHELVSAEAKSSHDNDLIIAVLLSILASIIASMGPLYTEYLFKNDKRSFTEMQLQLYMFGSICTWSLYILEGYYSEFQHLAMAMMIVCVTFTALIGISTAYIMKRLDNMVKLYAESLSGMLMTLACALLFPKRFAVDAVFVVSLLLTFAAIFLYEKDTFSSVESGAAGVVGGVSFGVAGGGPSYYNRKSNSPLLIAMVALCLSLSVCLLLVVANVLDVEAVASSLRSATARKRVS